MAVITDPIALPSSAGVTLLFSGGFDSTLTALLLKQQHVRFSLLILNYPDRPRSERRVARELAPLLGPVRSTEIELDLHDARTTEPTLRGTRHEAWFPYRNLLLVAVAAHHALLEGHDTIALGTRVWDGSAYDDASRSFFELLQSVLCNSGAPNNRAISSIFLPLVDSHALAERALREDRNAGEILSRTWSCWRDGDVPCGICAPCGTRQQFLTEHEQSEVA